MLFLLLYYPPLLLHLLILKLFQLPLQLLQEKIEFWVHLAINAKLDVQIPNYIFAEQLELEQRDASGKDEKKEYAGRNTVLVV